MKNLSDLALGSTKSAVIEDDQGREGQRWIAGLLMAVACTLMVLMTYEWTLRAAGAEPNFRDTQARWSSIREAVGRDQDEDAIAILGASQIRAAVSISILEQRFPEQTIYPLAYVGRTPCPALQDLAENTGFRGTVIISLTSNAGDCDPEVNHMFDVVAGYHNQWNWARKTDAWAADLMTHALVATDPDHSLRSLIENALEPGRPLIKQRYEITRRNRQLEMDFSGFDDSDLARMREHTLWAFRYRADIDDSLRQDRWSKDVDAISAAIDTINARGGQVVIVRLPTSGSLATAEQEFFPRAEYWDEIARRLPVTAALNHADYPAVTAFKTPDGNHLDFRDSADFTTALFDAIEGEGVSFSRP
ncbi:MAG: hypothetical protein HRT82_15370 [Henriciella sp.]|nr:hypothetical protein [Henriciella sp.]